MDQPGCHVTRWVTSDFPAVDHRCALHTESSMSRHRGQPLGQEKKRGTPRPQEERAQATHSLRSLTNHFPSPRVLQELEREKALRLFVTPDTLPSRAQLPSKLTRQQRAKSQDLVKRGSQSCRKIQVPEERVCTRGWRLDVPSRSSTSWSAEY